MSVPPRRTGPRSDPRFGLHQRQPRADKLDARQRELCHADPAFCEALRARVRSEARFAAFMDGAPSYIAVEAPCRRCGGFRKRTRDRSCYKCHLARGQDNFERMKAGISPIKTRSRDGHLDMLDRQRRERSGEFIEREFSGLIARRFPTGRLEITYPDGEVERDLNERSMQEIINAATHEPQLRDALEWAGWTLWPID